MPTQIDSRQIINRAALPNSASPAGAELSVILANIDSQLSIGTFLELNGSNSPTASINWGAQNITNGNIFNAQQFHSTGTNGTNGVVFTQTGGGFSTNHDIAIQNGDSGGIDFYIGSSIINANYKGSWLPSGSFQIANLNVNHAIVGTDGSGTLSNPANIFTNNLGANGSITVNGNTVGNAMGGGYPTWAPYSNGDFFLETNGNGSIVFGNITSGLLGTFKDGAGAVNGGGLTIDKGTIAIQTSNFVHTGIRTGVIFPSGSANQAGIDVQNVTASTSSYSTIISEPRIADAVACPLVLGFYSFSATLGAGSTIGRAVDFYSTGQIHTSNTSVLSDNTSFSGLWFINQSGSRPSLLTGALTVSGNITGNVIGNLTGNVTGTLTGNVTGSASNNLLLSGGTMSGDIDMGGHAIIGSSEYLSNGSITSNFGSTNTCTLADQLQVFGSGLGGSTATVNSDSIGFVSSSPVGSASIMWDGTFLNVNNDLVIRSPGNVLLDGAQALVFNNGTTGCYMYAVGGGSILKTISRGTLCMAIDGNAIPAGYTGGTTIYVNLPAGAPPFDVGVDSGNLIRISSSARYKKNIVDIEIDTSKIYNLRPVSFDPMGANAKSDECPDGRNFGLIAEEVHAQIPELVPMIMLNGIKVPDGVNYKQLSVLLVAEMKKLKARLDAAKL